MPRVPEIGDAEAGATQRRLFENDRRLFGDALAATRVYAHTPEVFLAVQELHGTLAASSTLPPRLVALARLRVAERHGSPF